MWHTDASEQDRSSSKGTKGTTNICAGPFPCPLACCIGLGWTGKLKLLTTTALLSMVSGFVDFSPILSDGLRAFSGRQAPQNPLKICFMKTWQNQNSYNHQHPCSSSCHRVLPHERIRNLGLSPACIRTSVRPFQTLLRRDVRVVRACTCSPIFTYNPPESLRDPVCILTFFGQFLTNFCATFTSFFVVRFFANAKGWWIGRAGNRQWEEKKT